MKSIAVDLGQRSYTVRVGAGVLGKLGDMVATLPKAKSVVLVADSTVAELYGPAALKALRSSGLTATMVDFPAGEAHKNLHTLSHLFDELFAVRPAVDRNTVLVALGGGVTGDIAGFIAATALRGLRFVQCPTTLLADVDSSVGGKTGVDHPAGKNLIGAFHQPSGVLIDVETLRTLPSGELQSGLAECVKHAMIRDESLLGFIEANVDVILGLDGHILTDLVARNVAIKAAVVSADERETGVRAHLNFGHTIGHAIETLVGYGNMTHGQAVALGMIAACRMACRRGLVGQELVGRLVETLRRLGLAVRQEALDAGRIWEIMQHDKKTSGGQVRMVLPAGCGQVDVYDDIRPDEVRDAVASLAH